MAKKMGMWEHVQVKNVWTSFILKEVEAKTKNIEKHTGEW